MADRSAHYSPAPPLEVSPGAGRVAVVGSGVAGLTAAYALTRSGYAVTLFEADARLGGHAHTHDVPDAAAPGGRLAIDTGFIVHNERTYPTLLRIFDELDVATQDSEMSMSVRCDEIGLEYAGALGPAGLFPTWGNAARPAYWRMLVEIPRFHRMARRLLAGDDTGEDTGDAEDLETLADFLDRGGFSDLFRTHFMETLVACVWSCDQDVALDYPARYLFTFLAHHGMLQIFGSPTWRTVTGGSRTYVERIGALVDDVRVGAKVTSLSEYDDRVEITDGNGAVTSVDAVVVATHPAQALAMLEQPTPAQRELLSAIEYSPNTAQLHTDDSVLPRAPRARASWNHLRRPGPVTVTYDLTRLMRLPTDTPYLVTLGGEDLVDPDSVIATMEYEHPIYTPASVAAQRRLPEADTARIRFAGAWHGWGFHEDGARSGVAAAHGLGATWAADAATCDAAAASASTGPQVTGVYDTVISHTRRRPFRRTFTHTSHCWLVDLDDLPRVGPRGLLGTFEARDHLGDPDAGLRENVEAFLALHDVELGSDGRGGDGRGGGRILMAAHARALGHCFNPISVFWCFDDADDLAATIVEVHNTYGDRHAYLVHPDAQGRARTEKQMYVSPFHGTDGHYELAVPVPSGERLDVSVTLHSDDGAVFSASLTGRRAHDATGRPLSLPPTLGAATAALKATALIRLHGVWLWLRRLPVQRRPAHPPQEGVR